MDLVHRVTVALLINSAISTRDVVDPVQEPLLNQGHAEEVATSSRFLTQQCRSGPGTAVDRYGPKDMPKRPCGEFPMHDDLVLPSQTGDNMR